MSSIDFGGLTYDGNRGAAYFELSAAARGATYTSRNKAMSEVVLDLIATLLDSATKAIEKMESLADGPKSSGIQAKLSSGFRR